MSLSIDDLLKLTHILEGTYMMYEISPKRTLGSLQHVLVRHRAEAEWER